MLIRALEFKGTPIPLDLTGAPGDPTRGPASFTNTRAPDVVAATRWLYCGLAPYLAAAGKGAVDLPNARFLERV